ncbi:hypothetical protein [Oceanibacterium hippocampi]|uniref:Uncharacterized protein n=1 Tax=Oceanibacterium hippocampi TaxID=745714 RepID=A0A1Y5T6T9_9PROT|nr:hypothetical protein [Oceanibacterium hippocampi]SLN56714.1 hypothetical protein OCH7691_02472 [Oceanibacterium hippocampi]
MTIQTHRPFVPVAILIPVSLNAIFLTANGLFMLIAPLLWYDAVPGVSDTGFFNQHFVRDIGLIQLFIGCAFAIGMFRSERRLFLWTAGTSWLVAHALFHFWEVAVGICSVSVLPRDFPAVTLPALIGIGVSLWAADRRRAVRRVPA